MMKNFPGNFLASIGVIALLTGSFSFVQFKSSGNMTDESRTVAPYDHLSVQGNFDVEVSTGPLGPVKLSGDNLDKVEVEVKNNTLHISSKQSNHSTIKVSITVPDLYGISIAGSGYVHSTDALGGKSTLKLEISGSGRINTNVEAGDVRASIAGSGHIECAGSCISTSVDISGSGHFDGKDLKGKNARADIAGSGKAEVFASVEGKADVAGSGVVHIYGNPEKMNKSVAGSGSVKRMD